MEYRQKHLEAQQRALTVIEEASEVFFNLFGRHWDGCVEAYKIDHNTKGAIITLGSMTGAAREAIDRLQSEGLPIGLIKIRVVRPFPKTELRELLSGIRAVGVVDRNVCFGWNTGIIYQEVLAAISGSPSIVHQPFIAGLGGEDITIEMFETAARQVVTLAQKKNGSRDQETIWLRSVSEEVHK